MPDTILLACTGCYLAVSGNLPPNSCDALLEAEWEGAESRVVKTYRVGSLSTTFSWRQLAPWAVPSTLPACATAGAISWCDLHSPSCPSAHPGASSKVSFWCSLWAPSQMSACRKVSIGTRGRKNLPTKFSV